MSGPPKASDEVEAEMERRGTTPEDVLEIRRFAEMLRWMALPPSQRPPLTDEMKKYIKGEL